MLLCEARQHGKEFLLPSDSYFSHSPIEDGATWKMPKAIASLMSLKPGWKSNSAARMQWQHLAVIDEWAQSRFLPLVVCCSWWPRKVRHPWTLLCRSLVIPYAAAHCRRSAEHPGAAVLQKGSAFILMYDSLWFSTSIHNGRYVCDGCIVYEVSIWRSARDT